MTLFLKLDLFWLTSQNPLIFQLRPFNHLSCRVHVSSKQFPMDKICPTFLSLNGVFHQVMEVKHGEMLLTSHYT